MAIFNSYVKLLEGTWPFQDFPGPTRKATERSGEAGRRAQDREKAGDLMILMMCRLQYI